MESQPPKVSEHATFATQVFLAASIGTAVVAIVFAVTGGHATTTVDHLAFFAHVFLGASAGAALVRIILRRCGR